MGIGRKWQEELVAISWINIGLVVMSLPLFSIYIMESLEGGNPENFMLHTNRGRHFVEIIAKYFASIAFWTPMSILLKIAATRAHFTTIKFCSAATLIFIFLLALQLVLEPPESVLLVCAYAMCFVYLMFTLWIMKNFVMELESGKGDVTPVFNNTLNSDSISNCNSDNFDELNDIADQRTIFRLQQVTYGIKHHV